MLLSKPQRLIFDMTKYVGGAVAVVTASFLVDGEKTDDELQYSVNELFRINEALRTRIYNNDGEYFQYISDFREKDIRILNFSSKQDLTAYATPYARQEIPLDEELCEISVIKLPGKYGLLVKAHHIISDAWTFALLATQFNSLLNGNSLNSYPYSGYIRSENEYLCSKRAVRDRAYFIEQYSKCEEITLLSEKNSVLFESERKIFVFNKTVSDLLRALAEDENYSIFSIIATVFAVYMKRVKESANDKFFIGTTVLNRYSETDMNTVGVFINTVPVLLEVAENNSFFEILEKTEDSVMSVFRHQRYNYNDLLYDLRKDGKEIGRLYDVMINYMNATIEGGDDSIHSSWYHNGRQAESLQIHIDDRDNEGIFKIHYDYQTEKFTEYDINRLHMHLCNILECVLKNPYMKISEISFISEEEKHLLLHTFNSTKHSYGIDDNSTLYSLFEKSVKENSTKICIKTHEREITFGEFAAFAENTDAGLRKITGNKKSVIAVIAERSVEMYAAIYGIIRGGNAYLPIDPEYPRERIDYILKDSNAQAVVCQEKFVHLAENIPCINMNEIVNENIVEHYAVPCCCAEPYDTAYVIYTSGSTGKPKGARISHKSALNRILWMHDKYPLGDSDVILQKTPYTFDVSVWEHFWWGICGGSLAVSMPGEHFLPAKILDEVIKNKVTHLHFVPSVFEIFLNYLESHTEEMYKFNSVRYVFLSGEALSASLVQRFYKLYDFSKVTLHNFYGPTECAVDVTYYDCKPDDTEPVPIGKPIYNTQLYVVDRNINPVPVGIKGELCICGDNVGQGYLNNSALTAEKFIDNPFGAGNLYRTGDIAYWREDGNIIFCGRIDGQIKLNGQRIETGEIESVINSVSGVDAAAVIVKNAGDKDILAACYCGKSGLEDVISDICWSKLPKYMVPAIVLHIDKMPLNQSGKLNRKALATIDITIVAEDVYEAPVSETEAYICERFEKILMADKIGRKNDFFRSGGTSLSMISLLSEEGFENISAAEFIRNSTPEKLAAIMNNKEAFTLKYLEPLHVAENSEKVMVVLPFAGGGAEAFSNFVSVIKARNTDISVYFVRYLHSDKQCEKAANEIRAVLGGKELLFYSHCVGSAVALKMLSHLEKEQITIKHYFAAASIPPLKHTEKNIWRSVPDRVLKSILVKAGADLDKLSDEKLTERLTQFREDTDFAFFRFAKNDCKISTPVSIILNKKDIFTKNYKQAGKYWLKYSDNIKGIYYIDSESHYFQSENATELVELLTGENN